MSTDTNYLDAVWRRVDPRASVEMLGVIPSFLVKTDPRPAVEQLDERYRHGGWRPMDGFTVVDRHAGTIKYPGDPVLAPLFETRLRDEVIRVYAHGWVAVFQPDGSFSVSRMD
jgi:hypothetical protein